jgi:predicted acyl esterase
VFNFIFDECQNQAMYLHQVLCEALWIHYQNSWNALWSYLSRTAVFEWHSCFKADRVSVEDDKSSRLPNTVMICMLRHTSSLSCFFSLKKLSK